MSKFYCPYCHKFLINSNYKIIKTHFTGQKHTVNRKEYYKKILKTSDGIETMEKTRKYMPFILPEIDISRIVVPMMPENFRLPADFDFKDANNYPPDYNDWEMFIRKK
ncbi:U1 small nuclear ribonucleoprotein C [Dictyocoela roeselum]|nr:U1 small nuclear ribonucleoprotein C [Dictyocoela roeselum]